MRHSYAHWLAGLALLLATVAAVVLKPSARAADSRPFDLEAAVPRQFAEWRIDPSIVPIKPSPDVKANLDKIYSQMLGRTYVNARGERMMLTIAYGGDQTNTLKAHRQEVCYTAQGFQIRDLVLGTLDLGRSAIPVTRMHAVAGTRSEPVTYWFTMGDQVVLGRLERMIVQLRFGLSGEIPDGVLVRVSNLSTDPSRSYEAHADFLKSLLAAVSSADAARLVGS